MKFKAIIFDMDGTIIATNHIWQKVTRELILSKLPNACPKKIQKVEDKIRGLALIANCPIIKEIMSLEESVEDLIKEKQQIALNLYKQEIKFIEGFKDFYSRTQEENLKVSIATNADDHTLSASINKLKLTELFGEHIYNITHVNNKYKPAPDLYLHAADKLKIDPRECIAIEDSHHGVKAAVDAGMFCIGINTGKDRNKLKESHLIIDHYDEICLKKLLKT